MMHVTRLLYGDEHNPEAQTLNLPRYNELHCQHATEDKRSTDQQSTNLLILMVIQVRKAGILAFSLVNGGHTFEDAIQDRRNLH